MSIFDRIITRSISNALSQYSFSNQNPQRDFILKHNPTALYCADLVASCVASMPLDLYRKGAKGKVQDHWLASLTKTPNYDESYTLFMYSLVQDYYSGNIYIYLYRDADGKVVSMYRLPPEQVEVSRDKDNNRKVFVYGDKRYTSDNVLHIPSRFGYDGLKGTSIYDYGKSAFAQATTLDQYTHNFFSNSMGTGKRLMIDLSALTKSKTLSREELDAINSQYVAPYAGTANAGRTIIKAMEGINYTTVDVGSANNQASQLLENREYITQAICSLFGVPVSFLKGENKYNNIETLYQILLDTSVRPICLQIQEGFTRLLPPSERAYLYFEFNYNALQRLDYAAKIEGYSKQINNCILSPNEVRKLENREPIEAGDNLFINGNLLPLTPEIIEARLATQQMALLDKKAEALNDATK